MILLKKSDTWSKRSLRPARGTRFLSKMCDGPLIPSIQTPHFPVAAFADTLVDNQFLAL